MDFSDHLVMLFMTNHKVIHDTMHLNFAGLQSWDLLKMSVRDKLITLISAFKNQGFRMKKLGAVTTFPTFSLIHFIIFQFNQDSSRGFT